MDVHETVGAVATRLPHSVKVFQRHGIDFCCGGAQRLSDVCASRGLDPAGLEREIAAAAPARPETDWEQAPLSDLVAHILAVHHRPLDEELPRIEALARKVARVHGPTHPEQRLDRVRDVFLRLCDDLTSHMPKEEMILFPWILAGREPRPFAPIQVMEAEHEAVGELLAELRELTGGYTIPADACGSWTALWQGLEALEADLHLHIHLENNILHPRALSR